MREILEKRHYKNCVSFIALYTILGILNGLMYDAIVTYLMTILPAAAKGIASYMGAASFAASFFAVLTARFGYKKLMVCSACCVTLALAAIAYFQNMWVVSAALLLLMTGATLFDVILAPFIAAYSTDSNRTSVYAKTSFAGISGLVLGTSVGGPIIVWIFSLKLKISYYSAMLLTKNIGALNVEQRLHYIDSNRAVIMLFAAISLLVFIPILMIKEAAPDHTSTFEPEASEDRWLPGLMNKFVLIFLVYTVINRFASALIAPQVSIYLTKIGINRTFISLLGTMQFIAILVFMLFSTKIVGRIGKVYAIAGLYLASVPFMLVLANGNSYGNGAELIIGAALFFRTGLPNAATPAVNSLTMDLVPGKYRSLYASMIFAMQSIAQILAGVFGSLFLFRQDNGYSNAYYYAAVLFIAANILLLIFFTKKYNQQPQAAVIDIVENNSAGM